MEKVRSISASSRNTAFPAPTKLGKGLAHAKRTTRRKDLVDHDLEGLPLDHWTVAVGDGVDRRNTVEHPSRLDPSFDHVWKQLGAKRLRPLRCRRIERRLAQAIQQLPRVVVNCDRALKLGVIPPAAAKCNCCKPGTTCRLDVIGRVANHDGPVG